MGNLVSPVIYHRTSENRLYFAVTLPAKFTNDRDIKVMQWSISGNSIKYEVME